MLKNRKTQLFGMILLFVAAILVSLSAVKAPAPAFVPLTGSNAEGLAQYQRSERGAPIANPNGLAMYHQSERVLANSLTSGASSAISNEAGMAVYQQSERGQVNADKSNQAGMAQYYRSERATYAAAQNGLDIYHQSERNPEQVPAFHYGPPGR